MLIALLLKGHKMADQQDFMNLDYSTYDNYDDDYYLSQHHETKKDSRVLFIPEPIPEFSDDPNHPHIGFDTGTEEEHLHNFKRISVDLKLFEDEYIACIDGIADEDFSESTIEGCLGKDFIKLQLDVKYETMKIISRADDRLRHFFVYNCYIQAGEEEIKALACDLLQQDMIDSLWNCMEFLEIADMNKTKYIEEYANMSPEHFVEILSKLKNLHDEFFELIEEVDSHKQLTLLRIKTHIDDRTKILVRQAERDQRRLNEPTIVTHTIKIQEKVKDPNFRLVNSLPTMGFLPDGSLDPNYALYAKNISFDGIDKRGEKDNRLRMLNLNNGYEGLHSINRDENKRVRRTNFSMKDSYRQTLSRLQNMGGPSPIAYKNTHTAAPNRFKKRLG